MRKMYEKLITNSCWNKATSFEMVFVLIGRDVAAPITIRFWALVRVLLRKNKWSDPQIQEALQCARTMEDDKADQDICGI